jgi:hypothetical protein
MTAVASINGKNFLVAITASFFLQKSGEEYLYINRGGAVDAHSFNSKTAHDALLGSKPLTKT